MSVLAAAADIEFLTTDLPWAAVGRGYSPPPLEVSVAGKCPSGGVGYSVVSGALPAGVRLSSGGQFSGRPARRATSHFAVRAVNGCSWTARLFTLVVEDPPVLAIAPAVVRFTWRASGPPPSAGFLYVSSSWPGLRYQVQSTAEWLTVVPNQGFMRVGDSSIASDVVILRVATAPQKPGQYHAAVELSAWQSEPVRAELKVE